MQRIGASEPRARRRRRAPPPARAPRAAAAPARAPPPPPPRRARRRAAPPGRPRPSRCVWAPIIGLYVIIGAYTWCRTCWAALLLRPAGPQ
jgi:hypothetical protein